MDKQEQFLNFLGIARKAGNLIFGMDEVKKQIKDVKLIFLSNDISENSEEKIRKINQTTAEIIKLSINKDENKIGKFSAIIAVKDQKMAKKLKEILNDANQGESNT